MKPWDFAELCRCVKKGPCCVYPSISHLDSTYVLRFADLLVLSQVLSVAVSLCQTVKGLSLFCQLLNSNEFLSLGTPRHARV